MGGALDKVFTRVFPGRWGWELGVPFYLMARVSFLLKDFLILGGTTTEKKQPRGAHCGHRVTFVSAVPRAGGQRLVPGAGCGPEFGRGGCSTARHRAGTGSV